MRELVLIVGLAFVSYGLGYIRASEAQGPCDREPTWQIAPPRVGIPDRVPLACIEVEGVLRCE